MGGEERREEGRRGEGKRKGEEKGGRERHRETEIGVGNLVKKITTILQRVFPIINIIALNG